MLTPLGYILGNVKDLSIDTYQVIQPDPNTSYKEYNAIAPVKGVPAPVKTVTSIVTVSVTATFLITAIKA